MKPKYSLKDFCHHYTKTIRGKEDFDRWIYLLKAPQYNLSTYYVSDIIRWMGYNIDHDDINHSTFLSSKDLATLLSRLERLIKQ